MTIKKTEANADKELEHLLAGGEALAQYHKLVEDLLEKAFKGKKSNNTTRVRREFEGKFLEAFSNSTHEPIQEIKPDQEGDFSPVEFKSTMTKEGIIIDTKVIGEEEDSGIGSDKSYADSIHKHIIHMTQNGTKVGEIDQWLKEAINGEGGKKESEGLQKEDLPSYLDSLASAMDERSETKEIENKKWDEDLKELLGQFKDYRKAGVEGSEEHKAMVKEGKRLTVGVLKDQLKKNACKMFYRIIAAVGLHAFTLCFWLVNYFLDFGKTGDTIIFALMGMYTFFYVLLSIKAYESIGLQIKIEEVEKQYEEFE